MRIHHGRSGNRPELRNPNENLPCHHSMVSRLRRSRSARMAGMSPSSPSLPRTMASWWFSTNPWKVNVFFLQLENGADPSDEFMKRFAGHKPPVKKASACEVDKEGVRDTVTGERGLLLKITNVRWRSEVESEVEATYSQELEVTSDQIYTLRKWIGKWKVTAIKIY
jgi:hypothetical protein